MISYILSKFKAKKENVLLRKLKKVLVKSNNLDLSGYRVYFIESFVFSSKTLEQIKIEISNWIDYDKIDRSYEKSNLTDNLEIYYIENDKDHFLILLHDPYDYLQDSTIIEILKYKMSRDRIADFQRIN
jgi:hypothetical protein